MELLVAGSLYHEDTYISIKYSVFRDTSDQICV